MSVVIGRLDLTRFEYLVLLVFSVDLGTEGRLDYARRPLFIYFDSYSGDHST